MSAEIKIPKDGRGVVHNFALPCTTCKSVDDSAQWDEMYDEEVMTLSCNVCVFWEWQALVVSGTVLYEGFLTLLAACRVGIYRQLYMPFCLLLEVRIHDFYALLHDMCNQ